MRLRGLIILIALCAALGASPGAPAAARTVFVPCGLFGLECTTVTVPLDRSGATPGTVSLHVEELPAPGKPRGVLFFVAGGPGQGSAGTFQLGANAIEWRDQFPGYTLVAFDNRGTGKSGVLRCPELHADRLLLDSVADAQGRDPFALDDLQQMPKGLASLCSGGICKAATSNFVGEVAKLGNRMAAHPLKGKVAKAAGGTKTVQANGIDFLSGALLDTDLNAGLAAEVPAAVHAALGGRLRPLLRLVELDRESSATPAEDLSMGMFMATVCDDGPFPWDPETPLAQRPAKLAAARNALPNGSTGPFGLWATELGPAATCLLWPPQARRPGIGSGPLPNVPVLVFEGERDLRTPLSNGAALAARFPQGHLVTVPGVGHSVLGTDLTSCTQNAVATWLSGGVPPSRCPRSPLLVNPIGAFPASLGSLGSRTRGRTLAAVSKTVREAAASWAFALTGFGGGHAIAGLYGGSIRISGTTFTLKRYSLVPGVQVSGSLQLYRPDRGAILPARFVGSLRVLGTKAARGRLSVGPKVLSGILGGLRVRGRS